mgnify:CR=1 FL=1
MPLGAEQVILIDAILLLSKLIFLTASGIFKNDKDYMFTLLQVNLVIFEQFAILIEAELLNILEIFIVDTFNLSISKLNLELDISIEFKFGKLVEFLSFNYPVYLEEFKLIVLAFGVLNSIPAKTPSSP